MATNDFTYLGGNMDPIPGAVDNYADFVKRRQTLGQQFAATKKPTATAAYTGGTAVPRPPETPQAPAPDFTPPAGGGVNGAPSVAESWAPPAAPAPPAWQQGVVDTMLAPQQDPRAGMLFDQLSQRATQSLNVSPNDPAIQGQTDAYRAEQERSKRDYLADTAESAGPFANLRGEQRLASERAGQNVGSFQAELMGRELTARRADAAQALQLYANVLSTDQQRDLQRQIALLDQAIAQQQIGQSGLGREQDWMTTLLNNEQFLADLGLRAEDRAAYYDLIRSGQL